MSVINTIRSDVVYTGSVTFRDVNLPAGVVGNTEVESSADIAASKLEHQHALNYAQATGSNIASATVDLHILGDTGTVEAFEAVLTGVAAGGDRTVTVDLHKSTGGAAFATILSGTISFSSSDSLRVIKAGTLSSSTLVDGDILRLVVTVAGSSGTQPQGLLVTTTIREKAG